MQKVLPHPGVDSGGWLLHDFVMSSFLFNRLWLCGQLGKTGVLFIVIFSAFSFVCAEEIERLEAAGQVYLDVTVRQVTPKALIIQHSKGIAQVLFEDMSPELQARFGYDPAKAAVYKLELLQKEKTIMDKRREAVSEVTEDTVVFVVRKSVSGNGFWPGTEPRLEREVDLRPLYRRLGLGIKNQNRRSSCAVFSVVNALEYEYARKSQDGTEFSEEFVIWAVRKYDDPQAGFGRGFDLWQVAHRVSLIGIPENSLYREAVGGDFSADPPSIVFEDAYRRKGAVVRAIVPGDEKDFVLNQVLHALNAGSPVVIGLRWPNPQTIRHTALLDKQRPVSLHAVTLVGYRMESARKEDLRLIFKNSWGSSWGVGGHGFMTYAYFVENVSGAFTIDFP